MMQRIRQEGAKVLRRSGSFRPLRRSNDLAVAVMIVSSARFYAEQKQGQDQQQQQQHQQAESGTLKQRVVEAAQKIGLKTVGEMGLKAGFGEAEGPGSEKSAADTIAEKVKGMLGGVKEKLSSDIKEGVKKGAKEGSRENEASQREERDRSSMEYAASAIGIDREQQERARQAAHKIREAASDIVDKAKTAMQGEAQQYSSEEQHEGPTTATPPSHESALESEHEHGGQAPPKQRGGS